MKQKNIRRCLIVKHHSTKFVYLLKSTWTLMLILKTTKLHEAQNRFQIDNYELSCTKAFVPYSTQTWDWIRCRNYRQRSNIQVWQQFEDEENKFSPQKTYSNAETKNICSFSTILKHHKHNCRRLQESSDTRCDVRGLERRRLRWSTRNQRRGLSSFCDSPPKN